MFLLQEYNDNLHLQDLPIAFCKLCQQNSQQLETRTFDSSILQISEDGQGIVTDTVCCKKLIQGQCVIMLIGWRPVFFIKMALLEDSVT